LANDTSNDKPIEGEREFCFLFDLTNTTLGRDVYFSPIEFLYLSRLCAIDENGGENAATIFGGAEAKKAASDLNPNKEANAPFHLHAPDESLFEIL